MIKERTIICEASTLSWVGRGRVPFIVIKPGPARRVDPGPGRPGGWTGSGLSKDRPVQRPGKTRSTRRVNPAGQPMTRVTRTRPG